MEPGTRDGGPADLPTCRNLGIGFVPYSLIGRGLLTGAILDRESLGPDDFRRRLPQFDASNLSANRTLLDILRAVAADKGITPAKLALAWVLHQGDFIVPIPGVRKIRRLEENAGAATVALSAEDLAAIERATAKSATGFGRVDSGTASPVPCPRGLPQRATGECLRPYRSRLPQIRVDEWL